MFPGIHLNPYKKRVLWVFHFFTENFGFTVASHEKDVNCVTFPFIWNFKPDKIKRNTLTASIATGGLNMINFVHVEKSLKAAWVNRYCSSENSDWCAFLDCKLEEFGGPFLFQCNYDLKLLGLADLPPFYRNILSVWQELHSKTPHNIKEMKEEILWNNRFI